MLFMIWSHNAADQDLWHGLTLARETLQSGNIPTSDPFAYTPTVHPFIHHEWGAGIVTYLAATLLGGAGIMALKFLIVCGIAVFALLRIRREDPSLAALMLTLPVGLNIIQPGFGTLRPQVYSVLFFVLFLWLLSLDPRKSKRWVVAWLVCFVCWVNLHGGFVVAFGVLAAEWLERRIQGRPHRHLLGLGLAMFALISVNPYGVQHYSHILKGLTMARPHIDEWQPLWRTWELSLPDLALFPVSVLILLYVLLAGRPRGFRGWITVLLFLAAAVRTSRMSLFYGAAWMVFVPGALTRTPLGRWLNVRWPRAAIALLPVFGFLTLVFLRDGWKRQPWTVVVPSARIATYGDHIYYPVGAVRYMQKHDFRGNLMVYFPLGAYVSWRLYPQVKVSMDSRYEAAFPAWLAKENIEFYQSSKDWERVLGAYPTDLVLTYSRTPLDARLRSAGSWKVVYQDSRFSLYGRANSPLPVETHVGEVLEDRFP